jgi:hypothetical protein
LVSVDQTGLAAGLSMGACEIEATVDGVEQSRMVVYLQVAGPVGSITIWPDTLNVVRGGRRRLEVIVEDALGTRIPEPEVVLSSEDSAVAIVVPHDSGTHWDPWMPRFARVTGVEAGTVGIVAAADGFSDTALAIVEVVRFDSVTVGGVAACGFEQGGGTYCWGDWDGRHHQVYTDEQGDSPGAVHGNVSFVSLSVGNSHICGLNSSGDAFCWGNNTAGQSGGGYYPPDANQPVGDGLVFKQMAVGGSHSCGITMGGDMFCWGSNAAGQLGATAHNECGGGKNASTYPCSYAPIHVDTELEFESLSLGQGHTCAVDVYGEAYCWGYNASGQLGDGIQQDRPRPTPVLGGLTFRYLSAGDSFTCGMTSDWKAYCWGANESGQVGQAAVGTVRQPSEVDIGSGLLALSSGGAHACAVTSAGVAMCWGFSADGRLGVAAAGERLLPVTVETDLTFRSVDAGESHTCAMSVDGFAYCWGDNSEGQLGVMDLGSSAAPVLVTGQPDLP